MATTNLQELLSCCCDAAERAGAIIRSVHEERQQAGSTALGASLKDAACERSWATVADLRAQVLIVDALRREFPGIVIVGEEDEDEAASAAAAAGSAADAALGAPPLRHDHPAAAAVTLPPWLTPAHVPLSAITVFVDPLDGTREFVEGRVRNVETLIGIAVRGQAQAGVIGLPMWGRDFDTLVDPVTLSGSGIATGVVFCGMVGGGLGGLPAVDAARAAAAAAKRAAGGGCGAGGTKLLLAASAEGSSKPLAAARAALVNPSSSDPTATALQLAPTGAAGNKILSVLLGIADAALFNLKTSLWDTCATEAVLVAAGGTLTDMFGARIFHDAHNPRGTGNVLGVLASGSSVDHGALTRRLRATAGVNALLAPIGLRPLRRGEIDFAPAASAAAVAVAAAEAEAAETGQASDVLRDADGAPLTATQLSNILGDGVVVAGFSAPESTAFRYKMSECVRVWLCYANASAKGPRSVFVKRAVMRELQHAQSKLRSAPAKLDRDVRSYGVEAAFLSSRACALLCESGLCGGGVQVARPLHCQSRAVPESPIDSAFVTVLPDFAPADGWKQSGMLQQPELRAALAMLARFHAFFWNGRVGTEALPPQSAPASGVHEELERAVWDAGTYWAPKRQHTSQAAVHVDESFDACGFAAAFAPAVAAALPPGDVVAAQLCGSVEALRAVGTRLQRHAEELTREVHLCEADHGLYAGQSARSRAHPQRTLIHGDPKAPNLFFRAPEQQRQQQQVPPQGGAAVEATGAPEVGLIDFQWCGWGLGATDVAYLLAASAAPGVLDLSASADAERALLAHYHKHLCAALARYGAAADAEDAAARLAPLEVIVAQYEAALLESCIVVFDLMWSRFKATPAVLRARSVKFAHTGNAYNKCAESGVWLLGRCAMLLHKRETQKQEHEQGQGQGQEQEQEQERQRQRQRQRQQQQQAKRRKRK